MKRLVDRMWTSFFFAAPWMLLVGFSIWKGLGSLAPKFSAQGFTLKKFPLTKKKQGFFKWKKLCWSFACYSFAPNNVNIKNIYIYIICIYTGLTDIMGLGYTQSCIISIIWLTLSWLGAYPIFPFPFWGLLNSPSFKKRIPRTTTTLRCTVRVSVGFHLAVG